MANAHALPRQQPGASDRAVGSPFMLPFADRVRAVGLCQSVHMDEIFTAISSWPINVGWEERQRS